VLPGKAKTGGAREKESAVERVRLCQSADSDAGADRQLIRTN